MTAFEAALAFSTLRSWFGGWIAWSLLPLLPPCAWLAARSASRLSKNAAQAMFFGLVAIMGSAAGLLFADLDLLAAPILFALAAMFAVLELRPSRDPRRDPCPFVLLRAGVVALGMTGTIGLVLGADDGRLSFVVAGMTVLIWLLAAAARHHSRDRLGAETGHDDLLVSRTALLLLARSLVPVGRVGAPAHGGPVDLGVRHDVSPAH